MGPKSKRNVVSAGLPEEAESVTDDASLLRPSSFRPKKKQTTEQVLIKLPPGVPVQQSSRTVTGNALLLKSMVDIGPARFTGEPEDAAKSDATVQSHDPLATLASAHDLLAKLPKILSRSAHPTPTRNYVDRGIEAFLSSASLGRTFVGQATRFWAGRRGSKSERWKFSAVDDQGNVRYFLSKAIGELSEAEASAVAAALANILNHWNKPLDNIATRVYQPHRRNVVWREEILLQLAKVHSRTGSAVVPVRAPAPALMKASKTSYRIDVFVYVFNPDTLQNEQASYTLTANSVAIDAIAEVPDGALELTYDGGSSWQGKDVQDANGTYQFKSILPEDFPADAKDKFEALQRLARHILLELTGKVMTTKTAKARMLRMVELHGGVRNKANMGLVDGNPIWAKYTKATTRETFLHPSTAAQKAGCKVKVGLFLNTVDQSWYAPVVSVLEDTFKLTGDFDAAFAAAAQICQAVQACIEDVERPYSSCDCDNIAAQTEEHPCTTCLKPVLCSKRVLSKVGLFVCRDCAGAAGVKDGVLTSKGLVYQVLHRHIKQTLKSEAKHTSTKASILSKNEEDCLEWLDITLDKMPSGRHWVSGLTGKQYIISTEGSITQGSSSRFDDPSLDAALPYHAYEGRWIIHTKDNLWIVENPLNQAKHIQIVPFMWLIGNNLRLKERNATDTEQEKTDAQVAKYAERFRQIRVKAAYTKKGRLTKPFREAKMLSDHEEMISGVLRHDDDGPWAQRTASDDYHAGLSANSAEAREHRWSEKDMGELRKLAIRYQKEYGVELPENDGCFYFCSPTTMPDKWDWKMAFLVCVGRFTRLRDWCNIKCGTIDTPKTIYIFCIIACCIAKCKVKADDPGSEQRLEMKKTFQEFLSLPLAMEKCSGIRFVLGHLRHGRQMWTGVHPLTLDFDFASCNILLETCTSNYLKSNHPESVYPTLKGYVRNINLNGSNHKFYDKDKKVNPRVGGDDFALMEANEFEIEQLMADEGVVDEEAEDDDEAEE